MWLNSFLIAAGVGIHARKEGVLYDEIGRIVVSPASPHGVDEHLWACLRIAVDHLRLVIDLHVPDPHRGRAVVIGKIGKEGGAWHPATLANPDAIRLAEYLRVYGFHAGEDGEGPALRLGPPHTALNPTPGDHAQHLWVSLPRNSSAAPGSGAAPGSQAGAPLREVREAGRISGSGRGAAAAPRARGPPPAAVRERRKQLIK